jgi:hypothetical protein
MICPLMMMMMMMMMMTINLRGMANGNLKKLKKDLNRK